MEELKSWNAFVFTEDLCMHFFIYLISAMKFLLMVVVVIEVVDRPVTVRESNSENLADPSLLGDATTNNNPVVHERITLVSYSEADTVLDSLPYVGLPGNIVASSILAVLSLYLVTHFRI